MDRVNFPNQTPHVGTDFAFESAARIKDHQKIQYHGFQTGCVFGFDCTCLGTLNTNPITINPGYGYTGDKDATGKEGSNFGSWIQSTAAITVNPPGAWANSTKYYVIMVLTSTATVIRPDKAGITQDVRIQSDTAGVAGTAYEPTAEVITTAAYSALVSADKHNRLIVAEFTTDVVGAPPNGANFTTYYAIDYTTGSGIKTSNQPATITGVEIVKYSLDTPAGDGSLIFTYGAPSTFQFAAPGLGAGAVVNVPSTSSVIQLISGGGSTIDIFVSPSLLPSVSKTDVLTIKDLFEPPVKPASGADRLLRNYQGSALPTIKNPLGLSLGDLGMSTSLDLSEHRVEQHVSGIYGNGDDACLEPILAAAGGANWVEVTQPVGGGSFYVNGQRHQAIAGSDYPVGVAVNEFDFSTLTVGNTMTLYELYLDSNAYLKANKLMGLVTPALVVPNIEGVVLIRFIPVDPTAPFPTFNLSYDADEGTLYFEKAGSPGVRKVLVGTNGAGTSGIYHLFDDDGDELIVYVDDTNLPLADTDDDWTITSYGMNIDGNVESSLILCNVMAYDDDLWGECSTTDWTIGSGYLTASTVPIPDSTGECDRRSFGTTGEQDLGRSVNEHLASNPQDGARVIIEKSIPQIMIKNPNFTGFRGYLYGDGDLGDVTINVGINLGADRVHRYRNLTLGGAGAATITGAAPFLVLIVQETLVIHKDALISMIGKGGYRGAGGAGDQVAGLGGFNDWNGSGAPNTYINIFGSKGEQGASVDGGLGANDGSFFGFAGGGGGGGGAGAGGGGGASGGKAPGGRCGGGAGGTAVGGGAKNGVNGSSFLPTAHWGPNQFNSIHFEDAGLYPSWWLTNFYRGGYIPGYGGGGGGGSRGGDGEPGAAGGDGGGSIYIEAKNIIIVDNGALVNIISTKGVGGGAAGAGDAGGGGGGGAGVITVVCETCKSELGVDIPSLTLAQMCDVSFTVGGAGIGTGGTGGNGGAGLKIILIGDRQGT